MSTDTTVKFNLALAAAYGYGMLDAQNILPSLTKDNAPNFLTLPKDLPAPDDVTDPMIAYRLGYWTECKRVAEDFIRKNA